MRVLLIILLIFVCTYAWGVSLYIEVEPPDQCAKIIHRSKALTWPVWLITSDRQWVKFINQKYCDAR